MSSVLRHTTEVAHPELRSEQRVPTSAPLTLRLLSDSRRVIPAQAVDCSENGLGLLSADELPVGASVLAEWNGAFLLGTVRHCRSKEFAFRIGVRVEPRAVRAASPLMLGQMPTRTSGQPYIPFAAQ